MKMELEHPIKINHNTLMIIKSKAEDPTHLPIFEHTITETRL